MKKNIIMLAIVIFLLVVIAITANILRKKETPKVAYPPITIGVQNSTVSAPIIIAKAKDFFAKQGLKVEIKEYPSGKLALQGMFTGEVDIATVSDIPIMTNSFERNDFSIFATIATTGNGAWITARKDKGINKPTDLKGKRVATQKNSAVHYFLHTFLIYNKMTEKELEISFLPAVDLSQALADGKIDAFSMRHPYSAEAKTKLGENNIVEFFLPDAYLQTFNLVAKNNFIEGNPIIVQSLLKALVKSEKYIKTKKDEAQSVVAKELNNISKEEIQETWADFDFSLGLNQSIILTLENEANWFTKEGNGSKSIPNYLNYIYIDALKLVDANKVTVID